MRETNQPKDIIMSNVLTLNTNNTSTTTTQKEEKFVSAAERFATNAKGCTSTQELLNEANMNWQVVEKELYTPEGLKVPNKAIVREDTQKLLGVVGKDYTPVQNDAAFGFFNDFLDTGSIELMNAGVLGGGKQVFIQAKIKGSETSIIGNDTVENYITIAKAHDGSMGLNIGFTPIRMFCMNQMNAITTHAESKMLRFRHTPKIHENMEQVAAVLKLANEDFAATVEAYRSLTKVNINSAAQLEEYVKLVFIGDNYKEIEAADPSKKPASQIVAKVLELFTNGRGTSKTENTYWKAYNAVNEYLNYERGNDDQSRFKSLTFGAGKSLDLRALKVAMKLAS